MRLLVTGGTGFIGSTVAARAHALGHEVVGVARQASSREAFTILKAEGESSLRKLCDELRPDAVVHAAGTASVGASVTAPARDFAGSVVPWVELLEAIRVSSCRPAIVFVSSAAVYGNPEVLPVAESTPRKPISPYGFHKLAGELIAEEYASCFGLDVTITRLFSVFGVRQRRLLAWELFEQAAGDAPIVTIQGTGDETRDFLHADDVGQAIVALVAQRIGREAPRTAEAVNLASGEAISVRALAELIREATGTTKSISCRGLERPGDPRHWRADVARLTTMLAPWAPRPPREGLTDCVRAWLRDPPSSRR